MKRCEHWESVLNNHIEFHLTLPRQWGVYDCCLFPCDWIFKAVGIDPAKEFRGRYKTRIGANRVIKEFAGDLLGVAEKVAKTLDMEEAAPLKARRGDVVVVPGEDVYSLGIVDMTGMKIAVQGRDGLQFTGIKEILHAWRVG